MTFLHVGTYLGLRGFGHGIMGSLMYSFLNV